MFEEFGVKELGAMVLAIGALGTAAMGVVEGLKLSTNVVATPTRELGFDEITKRLEGFLTVLTAAYGPDVWDVLRAQYCGSRKNAATSLRQGVRVGLTEANAPEVALSLGWDVASGKALVKAAKAARSPLTEDDDSLKPTERKQLESARLMLGQYELAMDARIDAAMAMANSQYAGGVRIRAMWASVAIAMVTAIAMLSSQDPISFGVVLRYLVGGFVVGLVAVPMAPVAKDVTTAIQHAATALGKRS